jgi:hypothetical protein
VLLQLGCLFGSLMFLIISTKKLMVPLNCWYKPLASTTETFVLGIGWYKCVIGTKKQLVQETIGTIKLQVQRTVAGICLHDNMA